MLLLRPLQLWRDIEMFQAFDLDEVLVVEDDSWHISLKEPPHQDVPWQNPEMWGLNTEYNYGFDLFVGIFEKEVSHSVVREIYSQAEFAESFDDSREPEGTTCVARLGISSLGEPLVEDCRISTLPWALTAVRKGDALSLDAFDTYGRDLLMRFASCRAQSSDKDESSTAEAVVPITWDVIRSINSEAQRDLKLNWREFADRVVIVAHRLGKKTPVKQLLDAQSEDNKKHLAAEPESKTKTQVPGQGGEGRPLSNTAPRIRRRCEILNSFFLRDIQRVAQRVEKLGKNAPLFSYLSGQAHAARIDVAKPSDKLWSCVAPQAMPLGRWPHDSGHFNSLMQQLAINEYVSGKHALMAVNGPPGTGKTTLVKDVVAAAVVQRALKLVRYRSADDAFEKKGISCEVDRSRYVVRKLKRDLIGFEVVVASSNNNAVENITRELPRRAGIGDSFKNANYLGEVARLYEEIRLGRNAPIGSDLDHDLWGLISVPLGNRRNREIFCDALLYGPREEKDDKAKRQKQSQRLTLHEWRKQVPQPGALSYPKARLEFLEAHKKAEELFEQLQERSSKCDGELIELPDYFLRPSDQNFDLLETQGRAPWLTQRLNEARSELFIAALNLHQAWVREAALLGPNLVALGKLLSRPDAFDGVVAAHIWQSLFMIVPAISTTLASVERMCATLKESAFGTIVLEEAGQATPQSVVGLMWRAKRALVIGDPMQIQPVISAPEVLVRHFCRLHKVEDPIFSPLASSAQTLADESNELGTYLDHNIANTWVGAPLRVHRRCLEPMFSISNTIAYSGLMTYGTTHSDGKVQALDFLPGSAWLDVAGACVGRHWVPTQGDAAAGILEKLLQNVAFYEPDMFFITPFRSIKERLAKVLTDRAKALGCTKDEVANIRRRIGTVHTFQGKEADIVTFVLGCDETTRGAARWAGERPNLVNVAVTRARHRLYVIGDISLWHNQGFFSELASSLPRVVGGKS